MPEKCEYSRKFTILLRYNNKKATEVVTDDMESFLWTDSASGEADSISLSMNDRTLKWLRGGWFPQEKDYVKTSIKVEHWRTKGDNRTVYCGKFAVDSMSAEGFPNTINLQAISIPIHSGFNVTQRDHTYKKTSLKTVLSEIAKRAGVKLVYSAKNHNIDEVSQSGKTDMEFAFSLCSEYDNCMKLYNGKIVVYSQTDYEKRKSSFTLDISDLGENGSYHFERDVKKMYDGVSISYNDKKGKRMKYKYNIPGKKGKRILKLDMSADSHADAERKAKAQLVSELRGAVTATFQLMGDPKYLACKVFTVTGFGKFNGRYFIDKVTHNKSGKYTTTIQCHKCVTNIS